MFFLAVTNPDPVWWQWAGEFEFTGLALWIFSFPMRTAARDTPRNQELSEMFDIWHGWLQQGTAPYDDSEVEGSPTPMGRCGRRGHRLPARRGAPAELRQQALSQLETARRDLIDGDVRYLGVASAELDGRCVMCLFAVGVVAFGPPPEEFHPSNLLAGVLGHRYSQDEALVEEFDTPYGPAVGVRRCEALTIPGSQPPQRIDTGAAQALVLFPDLAVAGVVSGYCLDLQDLDLTAAMLGAVAHTLVITGQEQPVPN